MGEMIRVQVKLYATLGKYRPGVPAAAPAPLELPSGATVQTAIDVLGLPSEEVKTVFVNGHNRPRDWVLQAGDEIGIFPPIGGG